jgi:FMN reductase
MERDDEVEDMASLMTAERAVSAVPAPFIVALGGTLRPGSSTEKALAVVLRAAEALGAETQLFGGAELDLPHYAPDRPDRSPAAQRLVAALRRADGIVLGSPGYHGGISGLVKNALDYVEDMRGDAAPYFEGRAVGCIATAAGWQATMTTLAALRDVVHALRGWPTPLGVPINTLDPAFGPNGECLSPRLQDQLGVVAQQIVGFAHQRAAARALA